MTQAPPDDLFDVPEHAIRAFERFTGLHVVVHDRGGSLWPFLPPERHPHQRPCCAAVKARFEWVCVDFDWTQTPREILEQPHGRIHVCPAGLVEWVVPAFEGDRLEWLVFAGQRAAGPGLSAARRCPPFAPSVGVLLASPHLLPRPVSDDEAVDLLEALRQLVARLQLWKAEASAALGTAGWEPGAPPTRRAQIRAFIHRRHTAPVLLADLARALGLSEGRTAHVVRQACGATFVELVTEARVRTAAALLRHTAMPVGEVALASGFQDLSYFHRVFGRRIGTTPGGYRRTTEALPSVLRPESPANGG